MGAAILENLRLPSCLEVRPGMFLRDPGLKGDTSQGAVGIYIWDICKEIV